MTNSKEYHKIIDFINRILPSKLLDDQKNLRIASEGDLQSCTYYHLREFIDESEFTEWRILNKLSTWDKKTQQRNPDIAIAWMAEKRPEKMHPYILIELKETRNFETNTAKDDIKKLGKMLYSFDSSGFFLYACLDKRGDKKVKHTDKIMEEMIPKGLKKYLFAKTINIKGEKTYSADMDYFDEKIDHLRQYWV